VVQTKTEGISYNPDGTIDLTVDGHVRHLRRPKLREFRHWAEQLRELAKKAQVEAVRLQELLEQISDDTSDAETERIQAELDEAQQARIQYTTPWTAGVVEQFTDSKPLPEDPDDWPAWLALDLSIPAKILAHWRTVPLAPGGKGSN
jgi:hypothetical protein